MKLKLLYLLCRINIFFPNILGFRFWYYKNVFLKKNRFSYDSVPVLCKIIRKSIINIPYYNNKYDNYDSLSDSELIGKIGFIDKDVVMADWGNFLLPKMNKRKVITGTTGGTSGKPLELVIPKNRYAFELGTMYSMWENVGWKGHIRAVMRNAKLKEHEIYRINPIKREVVFDGFRTSKKYFLQIYSTLKDLKINFIHAYPSSAYQFSLFLKKEALDTSFIKAFLCGSEGLLPEQIELIQTQLNIKLYHWYGHSEKLILGGYCKNSKLIHIEPTYGYFELIDEEGNLVTEPGQIGEMVGTSFHNPFMPLIRYKTGDYAEYAGSCCPHCKRELPLLRKIYGRWENNKIFRKDGSYISTTALNLHSELYTRIDGLQYFQKEYGVLTIKIIKGESFTQETERGLYNHYRTAFGADNIINIEYVNQLENEPNGKFLNLISKVNL